MSGAESIIPVILAGGLGTRLRPLTSDKSPKPFLRLCSKNSMFQETVLRASSFADPVIVCHASYLDLVEKHLAEINVTPNAIIIEPEHKGTAAAIALAAFHLKNQGNIMLVMPSDHILTDVVSFQQTAFNALDVVNDDNIVVMGVKPSRPETGYGYIICEDSHDNRQKAICFKEKPNRQAAYKMIGDKNCLWNTGIFLSRPRVFLSELKTYKSDLYKHCERAFYAGVSDGRVLSPAIADFEKITPLSVDFAVMEKSEKIYVCSISGFWSDIGTWMQVLRFRMKFLFKNAEVTNNNSTEYKKVSNK